MKRGYVAARAKHTSTRNTAEQIRKHKKSIPAGRAAEQIPGMRKYCKPTRRQREREFARHRSLAPWSVSFVQVLFNPSSTSCAPWKTYDDLALIELCSSFKKAHLVQCSAVRYGEVVQCSGAVKWWNECGGAVRCSEATLERCGQQGYLHSQTSLELHWLLRLYDKSHVPTRSATHGGSKQNLEA
eukprot:1139345-Pelagomonas_calceolata.AAC.8